jgi:hypothetical protein
MAHLGTVMAYLGAVIAHLGGGGAVVAHWQCTRLGLLSRRAVACWGDRTWDGTTLWGRLSGATAGGQKTETLHKQ